MTGDLKSARLIVLKGVLFLLIGAAALALLIAETLSVKVTLLALTAIWAFCRLYYFMFYVIEKYVDGQYRYSGVTSFIVYLIKRRTRA